MFFQPAILNDEAFDVQEARLTPVELHWHSDIEILYCTEGCFDANIRNSVYKAEKGDVLLVGSCEAHGISNCTNAAKVFLIRLGSLFCGSDVFKEIAKKRFINPILKNDSEAAKELVRIMELSMCPPSCTEALELRGRIYMLLTLLLEKISSETNMSDNLKQRLTLTTKIQKALDLVATHYSDPITLSDAAEISGYEKSTFCRIFKSATNITFHKYLNDYRIKKAMLLLEDNHCSIAEIAESVGFSQQKNFCRLFKETAGLTPSEYRRVYLTNQ